VLCSSWRRFPPLLSPVWSHPRPRLRRLRCHLCLWRASSWPARPVVQGDGMLVVSGTCSSRPTAEATGTQTDSSLCMSRFSFCFSSISSPRLPTRRIRPRVQLSFAPTKARDALSLLLRFCLFHLRGSSRITPRVILCWSKGAHARPHLFHVLVVLPVGTELKARFRASLGGLDATVADRTTAGIKPCLRLPRKPGNVTFAPGSSSSSLSPMP
jgi:hypothetical protein